MFPFPDRKTKYIFKKMSGETSLATVTQFVCLGYWRKTQFLSHNQISLQVSNIMQCQDTQEKLLQSHWGSSLLFQGLVAKLGRKLNFHRLVHNTLALYASFYQTQNSPKISVSWFKITPYWIIDWISKDNLIQISISMSQDSNVSTFPMQKQHCQYPS